MARATASGKPHAWTENGSIDSARGGTCQKVISVSQAGSNAVQSLPLSGAPYSPWLQLRPLSSLRWRPLRLRITGYRVSS
jgi:hypothetical protein